MAIAAQTAVKTIAPLVIPGVETEKETSNLEGLTDNQREVAERILQWLKTPTRAGDIESCVAVVRGYAGSGKSFMTDKLVREAIAQAQVRAGKVKGVAPTHLATRNLEKALRQECSTIHSHLQLSMQRVKLSPAEKKELKRLEQLKATSPEWLPAQEAELTALKGMQQAELQKLKQLRPMSNPETYAENVAEYDLLIADEAFMFGIPLVAAFLSQLVENGFLKKVPKILCLGDDCQLPPIKETMSQVANFPVIGELTEVVRQGGLLLEFVTAVRELITDGGSESEIPYVHQQFMGRGNELVKVPENVVLEHFHAQAREVGYENVRILTTSNARVLELNTYLYSKYEREYLDPYRVGDILLTRGPVMRDPVAPEKPGATEGDILFSTSTPITVTRVMPAREVITPCGASFWVSNLFAECGPVMNEIVAMHPQQMGLWEDLKKQYLDIAKSTNSRSKKSRGQQGDKAKMCWEIWGLKNWEETISQFTDAEHERRVLQNWELLRGRTYNALSLRAGQKLSEGDYKNLKSQLWRAYYEATQLADNLYLSFAGTVHTAQGQTIRTVILDFPKFIPRKRYSSPDGPASTWDSLRTYYTAVSRVGGEDAQLVLMG